MLIGIGLPCYTETIPVSWMTGYLRTVAQLARHGIQHRLFIIGREGVVRARNLIAWQFMDSECDALLFIDDDMDWPPEAAVRLVAHDKPIVAVAGPRKSLPLIFAATPAAGAEVEPNGLLEVDGVGMAFTLIRREVFKALARKVPSYEEPGLGATVSLFFDQGIHAGVWASEDMHFCRLAREAGFKVFTDTTVPMGHIGDFTYRGRFIDALNGPPLSDEERRSAQIIDKREKAS